jgi:hypothetical protein
VRQVLLTQHSIPQGWGKGLFLLWMHNCPLYCHSWYRITQWIKLQAYLFDLHGKLSKWTYTQNRKLDFYKITDLFNLYNLFSLLWRLRHWQLSINHRFKGEGYLRFSEQVFGRSTGKQEVTTRGRSQSLWIIALQNTVVSVAELVTHPANSAG